MLFAIVTSLIIILSFGVDYVYTHHPYIAAYVFRMARVEELKEHPTLVAGHRMDAWKASIAMIKDNPILGVGPFMSSTMYHKYRPGEELWPLDRWLAVHNEYLSILSERGILGFLAFVAFIFVLLRRAKRTFIAFRENQLGVLMLGLIASVISFMVFSIATASIYTVQFWLTVGLIIAIYNVAQKEKLEIEKVTS